MVGVIILVVYQEDDRCVWSGVATQPTSATAHLHGKGLKEFPGRRQGPAILVHRGHGRLVLVDAVSA